MIKTILGEALSQLKKEQHRLVRLISLRKDHIYAEEGRKTSFDPKELSDEIDIKIEEIRNLKIRIQKTNICTNLIDSNLSLAESIIKVNDLRKKIESLSNLFEKKRGYFSDKEEKPKISLLDELNIEKNIEKLESEKVDLDNKIQITNWKTDLVS